MCDCEYIDEKSNPMKKIEQTKTNVIIEVFKDNHFKQMLSY